MKKKHMCDLFKGNFYKEKPWFLPERFIKKSNIRLDTVIVVFSEKLIEYLLTSKKIENLPEDIQAMAGKFPIYKVKGKNTGVFLSHPGASYTVMSLEELCHCYSTKKIIAFGSCGLLKQFQNKQIIVPKKAYKFEGVSKFYDSSKKEYIDVKGAEKICNFLKAKKINFVEVNVATTDALYRETKSFFDYCKSHKIDAVDMEVSGIQSFCNFKKIKYYPFFYSADLIDEKSYEVNDLYNPELEKVRKSFEIAILISEEF